MKRSVIYILLAALSLFSLSCSKESGSVEEPYATIKYNGEEFKGLNLDYKGTIYSGATKYRFDQAYAIGVCPRVDLYSNLKEWKLELADESASSWAWIWPSEGSQCGKFFITVDENLNEESRSTTVKLVSGGKVMYTFEINQTGK